MKQAVVALIEKDGLFLSVSRKDNLLMLGLPGGSVENETLEEAMVREVYEETGVKVLTYSLFFKDNDGFDFETTCFLVSYYEGEAYSKEEGLVEWVEKEKLFGEPFGWYNKKVFEYYESGMYHLACKSHCCVKHGCKFSFENCPVKLENVIQDNLCEECDYENEINSSIKNNIAYLDMPTMELLKKHIKANPHLNKDALIMKALKKLPLEEEVFCNLCGLTCRLGSGIYNSGLIKTSIMGGFNSTPGNGEGALDDCSKYIFSLCEFCCDWLFQQFKLTVTCYDITDGDYIFKSAEERVKNDDWREMKEKFFAEKSKRDLARQK